MNNIILQLALWKERFSIWWGTLVTARKANYRINQAMKNRRKMHNKILNKK